MTVRQPPRAWLRDAALDLLTLTWDVDPDDREAREQARHRQAVADWLDQVASRSEKRARAR